MFRLPGRAGARQVRYDDDEDEFGRRQPRMAPSSSGMIGFILAGVSLALLVVVAILWYALNLENRHEQNIDRTRIMVYWFMCVNIASFSAAIAAVVFAARSLSPSNPLYRGFGMAALIVGILEIVLTGLIGFFLTCCAGLLELGR